MLIPIAKLLLVFALMLAGLRFRLGLGSSVLIGSLIMALLFGIMPLQWLELAGGIFVDRTILTVWGVVVLVLSLSSLMESTGQAQRLSGEVYKMNFVYADKEDNSKFVEFIVTATMQ